MSIERVTYVDVAPVRAHLRALADAGIPMSRVNRAAGLTESMAWHVLNVSRKTIRSDNAAALLAVTIDQARNAIRRPPPFVDRIELQRILAGRTTQIAPVDKPGYARALHSRGWGVSRISRTLAMSGTTVNKALTWQDAA